MNDDFHEASFEVYYVSVSQKLVILEFSPQFFFILTSVTSDTSWGQSMSLSDLYEVSNFSWICQLSYEVLFVEFGWKLKHPEAAFSQWAILDPPHLLNWPKSPHCLGLTEFEERLHFRGRMAAYGLNFKLQCTAVARECKAMDSSIIWTWKLKCQLGLLSKHCYQIYIE